MQDTIVVIVIALCMYGLGVFIGYDIGWAEAAEQSYREEIVCVEVFEDVECILQE